MYLDFNSSIKQNTYAYDSVSAEKSEKGGKVSAQQNESTEKDTGIGQTKQPPNPNTLRALEAAGLPPSERNLALVENMMQEGMRIDKENLQSMYRLLLKNPDVPGEQLIRMKNLGIEITDVSIRQFESYENNRHQILDGLDAISDAVFEEGLALFEGKGGGIADSMQLVRDMIQLAELPDEAMESFEETQKWLDAEGQLKQLLNGETKAAGSGEQAGQAVLPARDRAGQVLSLLDDLLQSKPGEKPSEVSQAPEQTAAKPAGAQTAVIEGAKNDSASPGGGELHAKQVRFTDSRTVIVSELPEGSKGDAGVKEGKPGLSDVSGREQEGNREISDTAGRAWQSGQEPLGSGDIRSEGENAQKSPDSRDGQPLDTRADIKSEFLTKHETLVRELHEEAAKLGQLNPKSAAYKIAEAAFLEKSGQLQKAIGESVKNTLFGSRGLMNQMKNQLSAQLSLRPEDVADEGKVGQMYEKLLTKMSQMGHALSSAGLGQSQAMQNVMNMQDNVQFMNQLNQVYQYVQLPLKMFEQHTNGDLYVYTNKKHMADADGNLSALLHLDMDHIGSVDVHVQMSGASRVATHFYLRDDDLIDFISENIHLLDERLATKGYQTSSSVTMRGDKEEKTVIEHMMEHRAASVRTRLLSVNSFDVKA